MLPPLPGSPDQIWEVKRRVSEATSLETVIFALYDEAAYRAIDAEL